VYDKKTIYIYMCKYMIRDLILIQRDNGYVKILSRLNALEIEIQNYQYTIFLFEILKQRF
jgi:hypothetical protein